MKIVYISSTSFADCDFPLLKEMKKLGHEIYFFMDLPCYNLKQNLIDIKKQINETGIFLADCYEDLKLFKEYMGLEHFYVINRPDSSIIKWSNIKVKHDLRKHIKSIKPDIIHIVGGVDINDWPLMLIRTKKCLTIHDPIPHTGETSIRKSLNRFISIKGADKIVILNETMKDQFINIWHLSPERLLVNRLGPYDCSKLFLSRKKLSTRKNNILFYGRISPYKGIEYLCEAMLKVREKVPDATLTIAGSGKLYFDFSKYANLDYIEFINRYIPIEDLAELLSECEINVLPYTDATQSGVVQTSYAFNKPLVATNVGGMAEYIDEGVTGLLVSPRSSIELADAITRVLIDNQLLTKLENGILNRNSSADYGWNGIATKYINFYNK